MQTEYTIEGIPGMLYEVGLGTSARRFAFGATAAAAAQLALGKPNSLFVGGRLRSWDRLQPTDRSAATSAELASFFLIPAVTGAVLAIAL